MRLDSLKGQVPPHSPNEPRNHQFPDYYYFPDQPDAIPDSQPTQFHTNLKNHYVHTYIEFNAYI